MCKLSPRELLSANIADGNSGDFSDLYVKCGQPECDVTLSPKSDFPGKGTTPWIAGETIKN